MRLRLCLILMISAGIGLLVAPADTFQIPPVPTGWGLRTWRNALGSFAIPGCLLILSFGKNRFIVGSCLAWGMVMSVLSAIGALNVPTAAPSLTFWGHLFLAAVFVVSAGTVVFSAIRLSQLSKKKAKPAPARAETKPALRKAS